MTHHDALDPQDELRTLLAAGLGAEPTLRPGTVDAAVAAGRRRRGTRLAVRAGATVAVTAALAALVANLPGVTTPAPSTPGNPVAAADPLTGPLTLAGAAGASAEPLRPDSFGPGSGRATDWTSDRLGTTLASLLPDGAKTVRAGDIPGRTFRVAWQSPAGPVDVIGGADRTADAPKVPLCATIALPKVTARPGVPSPQDAAPRTSCHLVELPSGARGEAVTLTLPQSGRTSQYIRLQRADGRTVTLQQWAEQPDAGLDEAALLAIADAPAWQF
ncbi:hypothetical protein AB0F92_39840 [Kitasatospora aureofaciens]|uniref:hypothetical protein n=1 Tax=Kitasatospora aureofaciens TaxID=1894 RepID=UPI00123D4647|nr:hypothetical protein CP971_33445 [Streptomyces viridifaciens]UKZ03685.1 hypothetical protein BOQ63_006250 [Streptomyces viridifaciens]